MQLKIVVAIALCGALLGNSAHGQSHHNVDKTEYFELLYQDHQGGGLRLISRVGSVEVSNESGTNCYTAKQELVITDAQIETDIRDPNKTTDRDFGISIGYPGESMHSLFAALAEGDNANTKMVNFTGGVIVRPESYICFVGDRYYQAPLSSMRHYLSSGRIVGYVLEAEPN